MQIYIVSKIVDSATDPSSETVGAYVDKSRADAAAKAIAGELKVDSLDQFQSMTYGVVESVELDLSGMDLETGALSRMVLDAERRLADH